MYGLELKGPQIAVNMGGELAFSLNSSGTLQSHVIGGEHTHYHTHIAGRLLLGAPGLPQACRRTSRSIAGAIVPLSL